MKEVITMHIGQAGIQEGLTMWEQFNAEHMLHNDGFVSGEARGIHHDSFYSQNELGNYIPRAIMIDTEPGPIERVLGYDGRNLFEKDLLIHSYTETGSCFSRGFRSQPKDFIENIIDKTRKQMELCDSLQGVLTVNSLAGGTGSGLGARILGQLAKEESKKDKFQFNIFPSPKMSSTVVAPYNTCFNSSFTASNSNSLAFLVDNHAMGGILGRKLKYNNISYWTINKLVAQALSQLTVCHRSQGSLNTTLRDLKTNLVPFPSLRYILLSLSPIVRSSTVPFCGMSVSDITRECFEPSNNMASCDTRTGKFVTCSMIYRGNIQQGETNFTTHQLIESGAVPFAPCVPSGIKVGLSELSPNKGLGVDILNGPRSCLLLMNTTSIDQIWRRFLKSFKKLYSQRAFVHWYLKEGMEHSDFEEAMENTSNTIEDFAEMVS